MHTSMQKGSAWRCRALPHAHAKRLGTQYCSSHPQNAHGKAQLTPGTPAEPVTMHACRWTHCQRSSLRTCTPTSLPHEKRRKLLQLSTHHPHPQSRRTHQTHQHRVHPLSHHTILIVCCVVRMSHHLHKLAHLQLFLVPPRNRHRNLVKGLVSKPICLSCPVIVQPCDQVQALQGLTQSDR